MVTAHIYSCTTGITQPLGEFPSLKAAKAELDRRYPPDDFGAWIGPAHRGGERGTWTRYLLASDSELVVKRIT